MADPVTQSAAAEAPKDLRAILVSLESTSHGIFELSLAGANLEAVARSYQVGSELSSGATILIPRREAELFKIGAHELGFSVLALIQGHYRHAFKGLRLVLELTLQAVYLSANELRLREWLANRRDTVWSSIMSNESGDGVFSVQFADAFFPELRPHIQNYRSLAANVYRECSECVHGQIPSHIPLPKSLSFDQAAFDLWHAKAETVAMVGQFALALRFLKDLTEKDRTAVEPGLSARLGHVPEIRAELGGPTS